MKWTVQLPCDPRCLPVAPLQELVEAMVQGLTDLGHEVSLQTKFEFGHGQHLLIGAYLLHPWQCDSIPPDAITYNTENIASKVFAVKPYYADLLQRTTVWDYSASNAQALSNRFGHKVHYVPFGYVPQHTCIQNQSHDIDVLFYGRMNQRRQYLLDECIQRGLKVHVEQMCYGADRASLIARSKVVANMHFDTPGMFEIVRVGYLLANHKAVVCEVNPDERIDPFLAEAFVPASFETFANAVYDLVHDDDRRIELEQTAFNIFSRRSQADILRTVI